MLKGKDAREALTRGVNKVADAVKVSAGGEGKTALIENVVGYAPHPTKDGVTIAESISLEDSYEELGCKMIKEAAKKTLDEEADGTTTTTILAQYLINTGLSSSKSHIQLREELDEGYLVVEKQLKENSTTITTRDQKVQVASVSANNDKELGELVADVFERVGVESVVTVVEGNTTDTFVEYVEGFEMNRGMLFPHFSTDMQKYTCTLENARILLFNGEIKTVQDIKKQVEQCVDNNESLLIVCNGCESTVVGELVDLKNRGILQVCVVISPEYGEKRVKVLEDISFVTGASIYETSVQEKIYLGSVKRVVASMSKTVLMPYDENGEVDERVEYVKKQKEFDSETLDLSFYDNRIANLKSAVAKITVGGSNNMDIKEKKDRVEDAVGALRSALKGGFVPGGGSALYFIGQENKDNIIFEAIKEPMKCILKNADIEEKTLNYFGQGIDVLARKEVNMIEAGIIDSTNVQLTALRNAIAVAKTVFQTEVLILTTKNYG